ncbi:TonB-dependent siderophore receptor, partial [Enterobacter kobei]|nr:TonB-dependent siderophore receptor [Enterobacter kobei]
VPASGSLDATSHGKLDTGFSDVDPGNDEFKRYQQLYSYAFSHDFNDTWSFRSNGSYTHSNLDLKQAYQIGWADASKNELTRYY